MRNSLLNLDLAVEVAPAPSTAPAVRGQAGGAFATATAAAAAPALSTDPDPAPVLDCTAEPPPASQTRESDEEFEIVFGRSQLASTSLVLIVVLACFSGVFYLIGKAIGKTAATQAPSQMTPAAVVKPAGDLLPAKAPLPVNAPVAVVTPAPVMTQQASIPQPPVFAEAEVGKVYIQVGAIEKGLAGVWAEGLRAHGLTAFVATGPSNNTWRVLVGPLPDPQTFQRAKDTLDRLGIATFGKKYLGEPTAH
jgi:hypothetical protein